MARALPRQFGRLCESEQFGHEKGAFTGADRRRIGKFEPCNGGTIFLDEVWDMQLATQGKVARLLQERRFERVGGNETVRTDVRSIAATNRRLRAWADAGKIRPDLHSLPAGRVQHPAPAAARAGGGPADSGALLITALPGTSWGTKWRRWRRTRYGVAGVDETAN